MTLRENDRVRKLILRYFPFLFLVCQVSTLACSQMENEEFREDLKLTLNSRQIAEELDEVCIGIAQDHEDHEDCLILNLPPEMLAYIFSKLDCKSLGKVEQVCRHFLNISRGQDALIWRHQLPSSPLDYYSKVDIKRPQQVYTNWRTAVIAWPSLTRFITDKVMNNQTISQRIYSFFFEILAKPKAVSNEIVEHPLQAFKSLIPGGDLLGESDEMVRKHLSLYSPKLLSTFNNFNMFFEDLSPHSLSPMSASPSLSVDHLRCQQHNKVLDSYLSSFSRTFTQEQAEFLIQTINTYLWSWRNKKDPLLDIQNTRENVKEKLRVWEKNKPINDKRLTSVDWLELMVLWYGIGNPSYLKQEEERIECIMSLSALGNNQAILFVANYWGHFDVRDKEGVVQPKRLIKEYKRTQSPFYLAALDLLVTAKEDFSNVEKNLQWALSGSLRAQNAILDGIQEERVKEHLMDAFTILNFLRKGAPTFTT